MLVRSFYDSSQNLEIRQEICEDGMLLFEGILWKGDFYGPAKWYHCNGQIDFSGIRYKDKDIGVWEYYAEDGTLESTKDRGYLRLIDKILDIK